MMSSDVMRVSQIVHEDRENVTVTDFLSSTIATFSEIEFSLESILKF